MIVGKSNSTFSKVTNLLQARGTNLHLLLRTIVGGDNILNYK